MRGHHPKGAAAVFTNDRGTSVTAMAEAFERFMRTRRDVGGIISAGGSGGTAMATAGMRALPVGTPKFMVSTVASSDVSRYVGPSDISMMYSVTDVQGINAISEQVLSNAAHALAGMIGHRLRETGRSATKPAIGLTMFGVTTPCVQAVQQALAADYDCMVFHATGTGGRSMEKLVDSGLLAGVIDITTTEVPDLLVGGVFPADHDRFGAIIRRKVPYVGSCGALDMVNFHATDTVPSRFRGRKLHIHNPNVTLMRTTPEENEAIGRFIVERLNRMEGPVRFLIPEGGVSLHRCARQAVSRSRRRPRAVRHHRAQLPADQRSAADPRCRTTSTIPPSPARWWRISARLRRQRREPRGRCTVPRIARAKILERFRGMIARGEPIIGGGAGTGLSAKCEEAGGIDLIVIYNSGRYRMAGRGSLAGHAGLRQCQRHRGRDGARGSPRGPSHAGAGRGERHRPVLPVRPLSRPSQGARVLGRAELSDRRPHRRHLPRQPRRDRHVLWARGGHDRAGARQGPADHPVRFRRGAGRRHGARPAPTSSSATSA